MLYIIGLGLNERSISKQALDALNKCKRVYLETYTVNFPYNKVQLEEQINKKIIEADRERVEGLSIVDEAAKLHVALLVYGSPLMATTHITLIEEAKEMGVKYKIIQNASIFDAVAETGLQFYKFGKTASMPAWNSAKSFEPTSFMEIVKQNLSIDAHSLILIDIGLDFPRTLKQLKRATKEYEIKLSKLVICQALGTKKQKIMYKSLGDLEEFDNVQKPYCIIIPSLKLHHVEKSFLEGFGMKKK